MARITDEEIIKTAHAVVVANPYGFIWLDNDDELIKEFDLTTAARTGQLHEVGGDQYLYFPKERWQDSAAICAVIPPGTLKQPMEKYEKGSLYTIEIVRITWVERQGHQGSGEGARPQRRCVRDRILFKRLRLTKKERRALLDQTHQAVIAISTSERKYHYDLRRVYDAEKWTLQKYNDFLATRLINAAAQPDPEEPDEESGRVLYEELEGNN